jgi:hypothetical protein
MERVTVGTTTTITSITTTTSSSYNFYDNIIIGNKNIPLTDIKLERITIHANPLAK